MLESLNNENMMILMIVLNLLVCYLHPKNRVFPVMFMLFEIIYVFNLIIPPPPVLTDVGFAFLLTFFILYNTFMIISQRDEEI